MSQLPPPSELQTHSFTYSASPSRVIFGAGSISQLPEELARLSATRALILCTPQQTYQAATLQDIIGSKAVGVFSEATMHTPIHITEEALEFVKSKATDCIISVGGGSTTGLGKAIAIRTGLPHICVATSYAGSEMTPILGETVDNRKTTRSDPRILPQTVVYDPNLTMGLPASLSAYSGVNAIAHAVEGLYSKTTNPIIDLMALEGIRALAIALPKIIQDPMNEAARHSALYGAWLCGSVLGSVGMGLHHKLCHTVGGSFNMPHAETHTVILPHALAYNAPKIPEVMARLAMALPDSHGNAIDGLNALLKKLNVKRGLRDFDFREEDIGKAAEIAVSSATYPNPRALEQDKIQELLRRAWAGEPAKADL